MSNPYAATGASMDQPMQQTYDPEIFTVNGRLGRVRYLAYGVVTFLVSWVLGVIISVVAGAALGATGATNTASATGTSIIIGLAVLVGYLPMLVASFILAKRRLNDLDQSGWLNLLFLVPAVNLLFGLFLIFAPGTRGPNRYGAEPCKNSTAVIVTACIIPLVGVAMIGILAAVAIPAYQTYTDKAKFSEVVLATSAAKIGVEICVQDQLEKLSASGQISGCGGGVNGVPQDITNPSGMVASVTTEDNGIITATSVNTKGPRGLTYILIPTLSNGKVSWSKKGSCTRTNMC